MFKIQSYKKKVGMNFLSSCSDSSSHLISKKDKIRVEDVIYLLNLNHCYSLLCKGNCKWLRIMNKYLILYIAYCCSVTFY